MVRPYLRSLVSGAAFIALVAAQPALADVNTDANALFVKVVQTWNLIQSMPVDDPALADQRLDLIAQVNANLDTILADMPGSDIAVRLVVGEGLGSFDIAEVRAAVSESALATTNLTCAEAPTPACLIAAGVAALAGLEDPMTREMAAGVLSDTMARADDPLGAFALLEKYPPSFNSVSLQALIVQAFGRMGQQDRATALIDGLEDQLFRDNLLSELGIGLAEGGRAEDAAAVLGQITEPHLRSRVFTALGDFGQAGALAATARTEQQDFARMWLATAAAQAGDFDLARATIDLITRVDRRLETTKEIALAHARAGQLAEAVMVLRRIPDPDNLELALALWRIDPDPAYVAVLQERFDRTPAMSDSRRMAVMLMNIVDPRPAYQAELDAIFATLNDNQRGKFNAQTIHYLDVAGRYADAAALAFSTPPDGADGDLFNHINNLTAIARAMAADPHLD